jgi:aspartate racemase
MKTIGLLGGMSWESTQTYYALINQGIKHRLGGLHSAKIVLVSVDFAEIEYLQSINDWEAASELLIEAARQLEAGGADFILICTNTMHEVYDHVNASVSMPVLHIADATGFAVQGLGMTRLGLLGTQFTMQRPFYRRRLSDMFDLEIVTPALEQQELVHRIIYEELCCGLISSHSRESYQEVIADLVEQGIQAVILGCTEIGLLISEADCTVPIIDTTIIHANQAVQEALNE